MNTSLTSHAIGTLKYWRKTISLDNWILITYLSLFKEMSFFSFVENEHSILLHRLRRIARKELLYNSSSWPLSAYQCFILNYNLFMTSSEHCLFNNSNSLILLVLKWRLALSMSEFSLSILIFHLPEDINRNNRSQ